MDVRSLLRSGTAAIVIAAVAASPGHAVAPAAARAALEVRFGQAADYSRLEFRWADGGVHTVRRQGQVITLHFSRDAQPDLAELHAGPPRFVTSVVASHAGGALSLAITLAEGADARVGEADGALYVNAFSAAAPPTVVPTAIAAPGAPSAPPVSQPASSTRANPIPAGGIVHIQAASVGPLLTLQFPWAAPAGAAVFRRGDAVWIIFDASARMDVSRLPHGVESFVTATPVQGAGYSGLRLTTRGPVALAARNDGPVWTISVGPGASGASTPIDVQRADEAGPPGLQASVAGATSVVWIDDPAVGDRLAVVTALGPAKGLPQARSYMQLSLLPSAQGLAVVPIQDGLQVSYSGDLVSIQHAGGLALSAPGAGEHSAIADADHLQPASLPTLIDASWAPARPTDFLPRYNRLLTALSSEQSTPARPVSEAHMALARFLIGSQLSYEAIGLLNDALHRNPGLGGNAEFRGLRGIANVMARRYAEAQADFASPALSNDAGAAAWRGYIAAQGGQWDEANRQFATGQTVFGQFSPEWRARFAQAAANASLATGNTASAQTWVNQALDASHTPEQQLTTRLLQARMLEAQGDQTRALALYNALMAAPTDAVAAPATLHATEIKLARGQITPAQAAQTFDSLRFRWRGDGFELDVIRTLGQLYLSQGRYREALETFRSAGNRLPNLPQSAQLQADLAAAFRALFIDGLADGLEPVQALALFYDFRDVTPVGSDGDLMVRRLVRRLVDVDLLDQAETLLSYQVNNRLEGVAKAQVATDLAVIYLMDRRPQDALNTINATRTTLLPMALNLQRRVVTARALSGLGLYDQALEMIGSDTSTDGQDIRAEINWRQHAWPAAGAAYEHALGERWRTPGPLTVEEEGRLLRAAVAFTLGHDEASLTRLRSHFESFEAAARNPDAVRVALSGDPQSQVTAAGFGAITADNATFEGWVNRMKVRFRQLASEPLPASSLRQAVAAPAPAPTTPPATPPRATPASARPAAPPAAGARRG